MANLNKYPLQDGFETSLAQSWNWAVGTIFVNSTPSFTFPSGVTTYVVVNPWKTTQQVAEINAYNAVTNTLTASNVTIEKAAGVNYSATTHAVGSKVIISDNYQFWKDIATAINSKVNKDEASIIANTVQLQFGSTAAAIYTANSGTDLTFKDWSNPAVTLSTLASGGWADTKVSISLTDTTPAVLNSKLTAGDGLSKTIINPSGNEILDLDIDVTDTTIFVQTSSGAWDDGKVPRLNASGKVASWFIDNSTLTPESLNDVDTYRAWEDVVASNSLFVEDWPTFVESTLVQNVGDVAGNTRFARPFFGSWVAINTFKLWLNKTLSPSVNFGFRIETDTAVSPSGTLAHANATGTVTSASLTTSLVDTTVTLAGSITLTLWQRYWIVWFAGTYGSETVNASNFFGVGYVARDTTTRATKTWNGTVWSAGQTTRFYYLSSTLSLPKLLSKTNASFSYKLPTDLPRIATETKSAGSSVIATTLWLNSTFSGMTPWAVMYVSNTAWAISSTLWTNIYTIWQAIDATNLYVWFRDRIVAWTTNTLIALNTARTTSSITNVLVKSATIRLIWATPWIYRINLDQIAGNVSFSSTVDVFVWWALVQTWVTNSTSYVTRTLDIALNDSQLVEVYHRMQSWGASISLRNFTIRYDIVQTNLSIGTSASTD